MTEQFGGAAEDQRIAAITLDEHTVVRRNVDIEHERATAIADLLEDNSFAPASGQRGPFNVHLAIEENRLNLGIRSTSDGSKEAIVLPLAPFRRIVKDYFIVCESYYEAVRGGRLGQVEAIDMGRRGLHNEGVDVADGAARRQGRDRPCHRPAAVHIDLRVASTGVKLAADPGAGLRLTATARIVAADRHRARCSRPCRYRRDPFTQ